MSSDKVLDLFAEELSGKHQVVVQRDVGGRKEGGLENKNPFPEDIFIPTTIEREVAKDIVFRPMRSWHSNTYAGEGRYTIPGSNDGSGCLIGPGKYGLIRGIKMKPAITDRIMSVCTKPYSVTHRLYWNKKNPDKSISAFLSYPNGLGACSNYFWETMGTDKDGNEERFSSEAEMEKKIIEVLRVSTK